MSWEQRLSEHGLWAGADAPVLSGVPGGEWKFLKGRGAGVTVSAEQVHADVEMSAG